MVLTNLAATFLAEGNNGRAAELYHQAKRYQPDELKAWENEALAHAIVGERAEALELARKIRERWPESVRALGIVLTEMPSATTVEQLQKEIPQSLADNPEICMVLSQRAAIVRDFSTAEEFARRAADKIPDRAYATFLVGQTILAATISDSWKHAEIAIDQGSPRLAEAEDHLTRAHSR